MVAAESRRYSYIRAIREIEPSLALEKFIARAMRIGNVALGFKDSTFFELPHSPEEELQEGFEPERVGIGLAAATIYPVRELRYTHFERLVKREEGLSRDISRMYAKVTAAESQHEKTLQTRLEHIREQYGIENDSRVVLGVGGVAISTKPQYRHLGEEYALSLTDGPVAQAMIEYNETIFQYVRGTGPGSKLCRGQQPLQELHVPFARLPFGVEDSQREEFEVRVIEDLFRQPLRVVMGALEWESRVR